MANELQFTNNSVQVKKAIEEATLKFLAEATELVCSQAESNTAVKTGETKGAWGTNIDSSNLEGTVGNTLENSIYEEFGTGEYALEGNGRKGGWTYKDPVTGNFYKTTGKKPKRALYNAFNSTKSTIIAKAEEVLKGLN